MTLSLTDVDVSFDGTCIFENVSIGVDAGEILTLVGPSGVGKTTLLRLLAAFRPPDGGTVARNGTDVWSLSERERLEIRREVSMVFQEPNLFNASVRRNVSYGLRVRQSWPDRGRDGLQRLFGNDPLAEAVEQALETVGLTDDADRNALSLSGGEAQRVAFARAMAVDPTIVLMDEPTSNLDPRNTAVLENAIEAARDRGVGVVVATHDMHQAERLSDRVGFVFDGRLVEQGPPEQIFAEPNDPRTAKFVSGELLYDPA